ncbi:hypothetical protein [Pyrococcus furiosus]|nr:hypothetical protein [Pyrococcus furiosus]
MKRYTITFPDSYTGSKFENSLSENPGIVEAGTPKANLMKFAVATL